MATQIKAVVFDMGGVIVRLSSLEDVLSGSGLSGDEIWERWILSESVRLFESGGCDVDGFATGLIAEMGLDLSAAELIERFKGFPMGLFDGAAQLVRDVGERCTTAILSNTNGLHWDTQVDHEIIEGLFDREYLSYALGLVKPDAAIYQYVIADLGMDAEEILFLDDNQINIDGALAVGMQATVAKGPNEARAALVDYRVL